MNRVIKTYWLLYIALIIIATGCLRSAGDGGLSDLEPRPLNSLTPVPTAVPTLEPETIVITATPEPTNEQQALLDLTLDSQSIAQEPTTDPLADTGFEVQQVDDPLLLTATGIVAQATQDSIDRTATAEGPQIQLPTFTETFDPNLFPTQTPTPSFGVGGACIHEVVRGENLFRLSLRYGVPVADLASASGVSNVNLIYPGQGITVPGCGTTGVFPPPTSVPGNITTGTGGFATSFPSAGGVQHTVRQYETLFEISLRYGVSVDSIAQANGITNPNLIYMTQVLTIP